MAEQKWERNWSQDLTDTAFKLVRENKLKIELVADERELRVSGQCPQCETDIDYSLVLDGVTISSVLVEKPDSYIVECNSGQEFVGAPDGTRGCGASFSLWSPNVNTKRDVAPRMPADLSRHKEWIEVVASSVETVRESAKNWVRDSRIILGLATGGTLFAAPAAMREASLERTTIILMGLLAVSFVCFFLALWFGFRAASGTANLVSYHEFMQKSSGAAQIEVAKTALSQLNSSHTFFMVALLIYFGVGGYLLVAPQPKPSPEAVVKLELVDDLEICGKFRSVSDQMIKIKVGSELGERSIDLAKVVKIRIAKDCP